MHEQYLICFNHFAGKNIYSIETFKRSAAISKKNIWRANMWHEYIVGTLGLWGPNYWLLEFKSLGMFVLSFKFGNYYHPSVLASSTN